MTQEDEQSWRCHVGESMRFSGHFDDYDNGISGVQFSLDGGASWTTYPADDGRSGGINWTFDYAPTAPGLYVLQVRAIDKLNKPSQLVCTYSFEVDE